MSKYFAAIMSREWGGAGASTAAGELRAADGKEDGELALGVPSSGLLTSADIGDGGVVGRSHVRSESSAPAPASTLDFFEFEVDLAGTDAAVSPASFETMLRCVHAGAQVGRWGSTVGVLTRACALVRCCAQVPVRFCAYHHA